MGTRSFLLRVDCDAQPLLSLWRTHCVFNQRLPDAIRWLFRMRRGECGDTEELRALYREVADFIIAARENLNFDYLMNSVSMSGREWKPDTAIRAGATWTDQALRWQRQGILLYDKRKVYGDLPGSITSVILREAKAVVASYDTLVNQWQDEYADWRRRKEQWERNHPEYMRLRDRFRRGEEERHGRFTRRAERDDAYLEWLKANPDLAAWRGGEAKVVDPDEEAERRIARAKRWKRASKRAEEFFRVNPELYALHRLHMQYEREFVRRRKRNNKWREGFKLRPTFTMPDPLLHPRWLLFNAPQTQPTGYKDLVLPSRAGRAGSIRLKLLVDTKNNGKYPSDWVHVSYRADPRLAAIRREQATRQVTRGRERGTQKPVVRYIFRDDQMGIDRPVTIKGARLILRGLPPRTGYVLSEEHPPRGIVPYLSLTVEIRDLPKTKRATAITISDTGEKTKSGKTRKKKILPDGLVSCAVDLDVHGIGFFTRAISGLPESEWTHDGLKVIQSKHLDVGHLETRGGYEIWSAGPTLEHIRDHKREIARARRKRGKPVRGERSHIRLQSHISNMGEDRFKKAARAIINEAWRGVNLRTGDEYPRADVLIMEDLKWFNPDAIRERGINRMLANWNRSHLMAFIEQFARDAGIQHGAMERVSAWGTSQVCSKCGALGRRYRIERDRDSRRPVLRFASLGEPLPLFACPNPECRGRNQTEPDRPFTCNADHNASINLHRRYVLGERAVKEFLALPKDRQAKQKRLDRIDALLRPALTRLHRLDDSDLATPF